MARCVRLFQSCVLPHLTKLGRRQIQSQWSGSAVTCHGCALSYRKPADTPVPARPSEEDTRRRLPLHIHCTRSPRDPSTLMVLQGAAAGRRWPHWIVFGGIFSFLKRGKKEEEEEEDGQVPLSVKRALLKAQKALNNLDYERVEQAYHEALGLLMLSAHAPTQPFIEATAVVLDLLANFYLEQGRLDEAEANFKETIKVMMAAGVTQEDPAIVEISLKLSKIYANQKDYELAGTGFEWCVETAKKNYSGSKTEDDLALLGLCIHAQAQFYRIAGQYLLAAEAYKEALKIAEEVYGPTHLQVAVVHNDLSAVLCSAENYSTAEEHVRASLAIARSLDQSYELREAMATFYCNLGVIMSHQGKTAEASEAFKSAMHEAKKTKDKNLVDTVKFHTMTNA